MPAINSIKVLEKCQVSPSPKKSLDLTFLDICWLYTPPPSSIFFYEFPHPVTHFRENILPNLKKSLSLTLRHFYILAGNLTWLPPSTEPEICYVNGDVISLTIAESNDDFNYLCAHHPRDENRFRPLVPKLPSFSDSKVVQLLALQITLFPNSGFSIGITSSHVVADGKSTFHFISSWASICRQGGDSSLSSGSLPFYDRTIINEPEGLTKAIYLKEIEKFNPTDSSSSQSSEVVPTDTSALKTTLGLSRGDINRLKQWVLAQHRKDEDQIAPPLRFSAFVVTCAVMWVCLIKAGVTISSPSKEMEHLLFLVDCRGRLRDPPVPPTYFGNCLAPCFVDAKKIDLVGKDGIVIAAKAIADAIKRLEDGILRGAERWPSEVLWREKEGMVWVSGSPKFGAYEMDFGWGKPKKYEMLGVVGERNFSVFDGRDGEDAVEVGLSLPNPKLEAFTTFFADCLKICNC
uniref:Anthocyanin 5-aromatic acyltransferase-like n=1 Tax=Nelumbo nucifera TaxID=4432 RepID=A0A822XW60_NELNU|nr:TPA_asm: hypothetical protein HUJ06_026031 [Nelumbo nucifera]